MNAAIEAPRLYRADERASDWTMLLRTALVGLFAIGVKSAGAAKTVFVARYFPPGHELDAFLIAFLLPSFLSDVLSGSLNPTLVPSLVDAQRSPDASAATEIYSWALYRSLAFLALIACALLACAGLAQAVPLGNASALVHLVSRLLVIMTPMLPLTALSNVWRSVLNSQNRFALAAATPVLTPVVTILCLVLLPRGVGVFALSAGTIAGVLCEVMLLGWAVKAAGFDCFPKPVRHLQQARLLMRQYRSLVANSFVLGGSMVIDQAMAATLGAGAISVLNFGTRLVGVLLAIGPSAVSTTILPRLSEMAAQQDWRMLRRTVTRYLLAGAALVVPLTAGLIWFSEPLVHLIFHKGALSAQDAQLVARVQACSLLQLPFSFMLVILTRTVAALKTSQILLPLSLGALAVNLIADYALMRIFGVIGIALSTAVVHGLLMTFLGCLLFRRLGKAGHS
jgi:putative peptidoglycan lipid II flippase